MKLILSPIRMDTRLAASVMGSVLTLNGEAFDFTPLPAGSVLPRDAIDSPWFAGDVVRNAAGGLTVPLVLPHGTNAPAETLFPEPIDAGDGPVDLPAYEVAHED